jgi:hypothetical protein
MLPGERIILPDPAFPLSREGIVALSDVLAILAALRLLTKKGTTLNLADPYSCAEIGRGIARLRKGINGLKDSCNLLLRPR